MMILIIFHGMWGDTVFAEDHKAGGWFGAFLKKKQTDTYSLWAESQLRYDIDQGGMQQVLFRGGILKTITSHDEIGVLYAFAQSEGLKEHRIAFQHVREFGKFLDGSWSTRARLEGRTLEDNSEDSIRIRFNLRYEASSNTWYAPLVSNEVFFNVTKEDWTGNRLLERNRLFLGTSLPLEHSRIEVGYLNQYIPRIKVDTLEHLLLVYIYFK